MKLDNRLKSRLKEKKLKQQREQRLHNLTLFAFMAAVTVYLLLASADLAF